MSAFHLRLRGRLLLHASAVRRDGRTVAFAGPAGAGKSTLAAALVARGALGVTDDVLVVERGAEPQGVRWHVHPGPPRHLLWPDAAAVLAPAAGDGEPPGPNPCRWDKRALPPPRWSDPSAPLPLDRLLLVAPAAASAAAAVRACAPGRAVAVMVGSLHAGWFGDARRRRTDLDGAADLVATLGARELVVPRAFARLPEVAAVVEDELRGDGP